MDRWKPLKAPQKCANAMESLSNVVTTRLDRKMERYKG